ncbi:uncharacterized protein AKAW2_20153S [Aspergillus luchuensis]|uniref:Uncharacterized protein n=1 Tax=Aspergillus kawachii TaxID=1069201 RepID=A0A146F3T7_ASPKA|nr:uncharacterized protein AKAW2_20153S [Aspergillus luchuensis]BCR95213.1 hypothetical protein AKAW2_20153S [Aspergillus luchuensis]BCS07777.1 hypothetical protein ALUC_20147S [Aspergillus luchuensis]GAA89626.1 hypothetical protein AKAW_07740 [Aspergillus luchuensis IFO 4308]GAT20489.1 hypothetical protein RIB2604_00701730 [Aspergillus luchuensis]
MDYNAADLSSVLRTLSALSNQQQPQAQSQLQLQPQSHPPYSHNPDPTTQTAPTEDNDPYEPTESLPQLPIPPKPTSSRPQHPQTQPHPQPRPAPAGPITEDTSTITTWPTALRYVMRTVAQNEEIQRRLRWLIQRQHDHEKQWWQGREALLKKQSARTEKKKELDAVLRSVGAPVDENKQVSTAEEDRAELTNYDAKVYKASRQMSDAMIAELKALRIPFFTIKKGLVSESDPSNMGRTTTTAPTVKQQQQQQLSREELSALQLRMLELLQDLCRE